MTAPLPPPDPTADFDAFYKDARGRLLVQTYALTGDLGAARSAVRDAFVVAWHHWRKVSRLPDPESSVRPHAWRAALRRASTRPWHKEKDLSAEDRRTLESLAALPVIQRRALLLTQLATVSMPDLARELGLTAETAERELQTAAAQFARHRDIPTSAIPMALAALGDSPGTGVTWPRVTIIRRAGAARRRMHTAVGAAVVVVALVASGALVTDATGVRPTLHREPVPSRTVDAVAAGPEVNLPDTSLLPREPVNRTLVGSWRQGATHDNSSGNGLVVPCQPSDPDARYADPHGEAAWVRVFRNGKPKEATRRVVQLAEASTGERRARKAYRRLRGWVTGCQTPGVRLVSTAHSPGVGDQSAVLVLHDEHPETTTYVVGIARTGLFVTAVVLETDVSPSVADRAGLANLLGVATERLCQLPDGGRCAADATSLEELPAFPTGDVRALLSPLDLPFVGRPDEPWMGTPARQITRKTTDIDVLGCNNPDLDEEFEGTRLRTDLARTYLKVGKSLPPEFGLTEAVAALPKKKAGKLVDAFRAAIRECPDLDASAGTEVTELERHDDGDESFSAWHLSTRLPGERTVEYDVAIVRSGDAVAQLVFISAEDARMSEEQFVSLTRRALERLPKLPRYRG